MGAMALVVLALGVLVFGCGVPASSPSRASRTAVLAWQHLDGDRNVRASDAIMRGDPEPMRTMLDELIENH